MSDSESDAEVLPHPSGEVGAASPSPRKRAPRKTVTKKTVRKSAPQRLSPAPESDPDLPFLLDEETQRPEAASPVSEDPSPSAPLLLSEPSPLPPASAEASADSDAPAPAPAPSSSPELEPSSIEGKSEESAGENSGRKSRHRRRKRRGDRENQAEDSPSQSAEDDGDSTDSSFSGGGSPEAEGEGGEARVFKTRKQRFLERKEKERARELAALEASPAIESEGIVEISPKGFGFLRERIRGFQQSPKDVFITPEIVRTYGLRDGLMVRCISKNGVRGPQLVDVLSINGRPPEETAMLPYFEELTAINPNKKLTLETDPTRMTTRVIDLVAPIGRGQRGLIVAPPRTGKTTFLHHIAEGLLKNYEDEIHLMVVLVDERPEEVTDFERSFPDVEVFSSSNDSEAKDHTRIALLATERAKRLVEGGRHVVMLLDSITRLARAFNSQMRGGGKGTASGGLIVGALEAPRRIFAAARNTREAGSLTIIATALVQTNSKADEAIFQEFKGTGNMELVLDRQLAQSYIYPAVDINKSGTRREELLLPPHVLEKIYVIRRGLSGYRPADAMEWLLRCMQRYPTNAQMLMDIKVTALA